MPFICYECRKPLPPVALTNNKKAVCDMCHAMLETKLMLKRWEDGLCSKCGYQTYGAECLYCYIRNLKHDLKSDKWTRRELVGGILGVAAICITIVFVMGGFQ